jgi:Na+/H+-dicarboxylate symporter
MVAGKGGGLIEPSRAGLTRRILIGMGAGLVLGVALNATGASGPVAALAVDGVFYVGGEIFLASLKLLVVPLVFVSLVCGTAAMEDVTRLGRVGGKTLGLYLATTAAAITVALSAAVMFQPGSGFDLTTEATFSAKSAPSLRDVIVGLFPSNPIRAMADGNMLQIIVFAGLFGLSLTLSGAPGRRLLAFFTDLNAAVMRLVMILMLAAPYGVFCLVARVFAEQGLAAIAPLVAYFLVVVGSLLVHAGITYSLLLRLLAGLDPVTFYRKMRDPLALAFSTASSGATLPVTLKTAERELGADNSVASFTVPLGATINMDGTAIMQGVATGFIAQAYGIDLGPGDYLMVVLTATLASIGTAGVPGVGLVMLAMVLEQVSLPVEGIALVLGVDRLLDMLRTAVNVAGDGAVTCIVARSEGRFSQETFEARRAPD